MSMKRTNDTVLSTHLKKLRDSCKLARQLTDDQFDKLNQIEQRLLMIRWEQPDNLVFEIMVGHCQQSSSRGGKLSPPPSVYAKHEMASQNISELRLWFQRTSKKVQQQEINKWNNHEYDLAEVCSFHSNIATMLRLQHELFLRITNECEVKVDLSTSKGL
jgi:hypothetical protein